MSFIVSSRRRATTLALRSGDSWPLLFADFKECRGEKDGGIFKDWEQPEYYFFKGEKNQTNWRLILRISIRLRNGTFLRVTFIVDTGCPYGLEVNRETYRILFSSFLVSEVWIKRKRFPFFEIDKSLEPVNLIGLKVIEMFGLFVGFGCFTLRNFPLFLNAPEAGHLGFDEEMKRIVQSLKTVESSDEEVKETDQSLKTVESSNEVKGTVQDKSSSSSSSSSFSSSSSSPSADIADVVFFGNLPFQTPVGSLFDFLEEKGFVVKSVCPIRDEKGRLRKMCYVEFDNPETTKKVLEGLSINGRILQIRKKSEILRDGFPDKSVMVVAWDWIRSRKRLMSFLSLVLLLLLLWWVVRRK